MPRLRSRDNSGRILRRTKSAKNISKSRPASRLDSLYGGPNGIVAQHLPIENIEHMFAALGRVNNNARDVYKKKTLNMIFSGIPQMHMIGIYTFQKVNTYMFNMIWKSGFNMMPNTRTVCTIIAPSLVNRIDIEYGSVALYMQFSPSINHSYMLIPTGYEKNATPPYRVWFDVIDISATSSSSKVNKRQNAVNKLLMRGITEWEIIKNMNRRHSSSEIPTVHRLAMKNITHSASQPQLSLAAVHREYGSRVPRWPLVTLRQAAVAEARTKRSVRTDVLGAARAAQQEHAQVRDSGRVLANAQGALYAAESSFN